MDVKLKDKYDVIVIGGGITGAGTARDCAMRGLSVLLIERFDFAHGATGRNHGLLHSAFKRTPFCAKSPLTVWSPPMAYLSHFPTTI